MQPKLKKFFRTIALGSICVILWACSSTSTNKTYLTASAPELTYPDTVQTYQTQAELTDDEIEKNDYGLKVAGRLIHDGQPNRAAQQIESLQQLTSEQTNEKSLLLAKLALLRHQPRTALKQASNIKKVDELPMHLQQFYHQLLADTYHLRGAVINEVDQLIALDNLHNNELSKLSIRRSIWRALSNLSIPRTQANALEAQGELAGWLNLNLITKQFRDDNIALIEQVKQWQLTYPQHSANAIVQINENSLIHAPTKLALLLPLSGQLSGPGQAIRDGVMASYFEAKQKAAAVRFYDTANKDVLTQYHQAIKDGAEFVIGPLTKKNVEIIANTSHPVPTLALNDVEKPDSNNLYRFSVDPQNEAKQLAHYVHNKGLRRALIIAPKGTWGESIANAFNQSWQQSGGEISSTLLFENKTEINGAIRDFLGVAHSYDRYNNLVKTIWKRPKFYARRRQDFDSVILLSYASMARQIRPMLNYYYAGDLPVYGTSLLYSGSPKPRQDSDLNGVIFAEMPYLLNKQKPLLSKTWPEQFNSYNRLYAMGKDAFLLSHQLNILNIFPMMGVTDNTGTLFIDNNRQIVRQLTWAQFKKGVVQKLS